MLDPANGLAPVDSARMAARIVDSVDIERAPLGTVPCSLASESTLTTLRERIADLQVQLELAALAGADPARSEQSW